MPNGQYLLFFPSLLSVLFVILARRRVLPGPAASGAAAERLAVPALCAICAQVRVTARARQIYVLIAWERAGSPVCALCLIRAVDLTHPKYNVLNMGYVSCVTQVHVSQISVSLWKILTMNMRAKR